MWPTGWSTAWSAARSKPPSVPVAEQLGSIALRHRLPAPLRSAAAGGAPLRLLPRSEGVPLRADTRAIRRQRLEAVLFLLREPATLRRLAQLASLADATEARGLLRELSERYDERGYAFGVAPLAGGYQLRTRSKLSPWLEKFSPPADDLRLSAPAMETLAVVAYRQPVPRAEVEAIRGVQCGELLRQLMDRELLRIFGRSKELGRPLLYGTTRRFLQVFGLQSLQDLPHAEELAGGAEGPRAAA